MCWMAAGWVITNSAHVTQHTTHNESPKCIGNLQAAKQAKLFCWFTKDKHNWITERAHGHGYEHGHVCVYVYVSWQGPRSTLRIRNVLLSLIPSVFVCTQTMCIKLPIICCCSLIAFIRFYWSSLSGANRKATPTSDKQRTHKPKQGPSPLQYKLEWPG